MFIESGAECGNKSLAEVVGASYHRLVTNLPSYKIVHPSQSCSPIPLALPRPIRALIRSSRAGKRHGGYRPGHHLVSIPHLQWPTRPPGEASGRVRAVVSALAVIAHRIPVGLWYLTGRNNNNKSNNNNDNNSNYN